MRQSDKIKDGQRNQSPALIAHSAVGEGDQFFSQKSEVYGIPGSEGGKGREWYINFQKENVKSWYTNQLK